MASTTAGCAWPVDATAMPALKSRNRLPSTSSTTQPAPRLGTNSYARGSEGLVSWRSRSMISRARGPGISVRRALPPTERLHARPRAGRRPRTAVHVHHARLDLGQEPVDLRAILAVEAGGQAVLGVVRQLQPLVERVDRGHGHERHEQLLLPDPGVERNLDDRGRHEVAARQVALLDPLPAGDHRAALLGLLRGFLEGVDRSLVDDGTHEHVLLE